MNSYGGYDGGNETAGGEITGGAMDQMALNEHQAHMYDMGAMLCMVLSILVILMILYMVGSYMMSMMGSRRDERYFSPYGSTPASLKMNFDNRFAQVEDRRFLGASDGGPTFWNIGDVDQTAEVLNKENKSVTRDGTDDSNDFGAVVSGQNGAENAYGKVDTREDIKDRDKMGPGQYYKFNSRRPRYFTGGPYRPI